MSENRVAAGNFAVEFLDRIGAPDALAEPENRKAFILGMGYDDFKQWLIRMNGMARGLKGSERGIDGKQVTTPDMLPPDPRDKESLLETALTAAKSILSRRENTAEALEDVSLLFSGVINYVHPFKDGNGRTSRIAGLLMREGYDGSDKAKDRLKAVMNTDGGVAFQNNPFDLTPWLDYKVKLSMGARGVADIVPKGRVVTHLGTQAQAAIDRIVEDVNTGYTAISAVMIGRNLLPDGVDPNSPRAIVPDEEYLKKFGEQDVAAVLETSRDMRRNRVLTFIDAIKEPDAYPITLTKYTDNAYGRERGTTLRDYYADFIQANSTLYMFPEPDLSRRALGERALQ